MADRPPVVNTIPSHDVVLRRLVERVAAESNAETAEELTEKLRPLYPRVAVFERQLSGDRGRLYVYRDGRYEPPTPRSWWEAPDVPCVRVSMRTGEITHVSGPWAALMRSDSKALVGKHYLDFVQPAARDVAGAMFEAIQSEGEVRSEAVVQRPDATTLLIEFRAVRRDDDIEVCYRPIEG